MIKRGYFIVFVLLGWVLAACQSSSEEACAEAQEVRYEYGLPVDSFRIDTCVVREGQTLGGILNILGATPQQINRVSVLPREIGRAHV